MFRESELPVSLDEGRYTLVKSIGAGGMATVYESEVNLECFDFGLAVATAEADMELRYRPRMAKIDLRREQLADEPNARLRAYCDKKRYRYPREGRVAVKVMMGGHEKWEKRFEDEWRLMSALRGKRLIPVYGGGVCREHGLPYYAMKLLEGVVPVDTLPRMKPPYKLGLALQAVEALSTLHDEGIIHRDVKPHNLIVIKEGSGYVLFLSDLGIARDTSRTQGLTAQGEVMGSMYYMAPEQAGGMSDATLASDVYGLGATFYHWFAKRAPYQGLPTREILTRVARRRAPILIDDLVAGLPQALIELIDAMMAHEPNDRPTLVEVEMNLEEIIEEER